MKINILFIFFMKITLLHGQLDTTESILAFLEPVWEHDLGENYSLKQPPTYYKGFLFPYAVKDYCLNAITGEVIPINDWYAKIKDTTIVDSLILYDYGDTYNIKKFVDVINLKNGNLIFSKRKEKNYYLGYHQQEIFKNISLFRLSNFEIGAYNNEYKKMIWKTKLSERFWSKPQSYKNKYLVTAENHIFFLNNQGHITDSIKIEGIASGLYIKENKGIVWAENKGVFCVNLDTKKIVWKYNDKDFNYKFGCSHFIVEEKEIYFSNHRIYAVNLENGHLIWRTEEKCSQFSWALRKFNQYLIYYDFCHTSEEGDKSKLSALNVENKITKYRGWKSLKIEEKNSTPSDLDSQTLKFNNMIYNNMVFARGKRKIYAFKLVPKKSD